MSFVACGRGVCKLLRKCRGVSLDCQDEFEGDVALARPPSTPLLAASKLAGKSRARSFRATSREQFVLANRGDIQDFYNIERKPFAEGTYGTVRRATCKATGLQRAVKTISKSTMQDTLRREIEFTRVVDHLNIIKLFGVFESQSVVALVTEFCSGGELLDWFDDAGSITEPQVATVMKQICGTVAYLHGVHICHRDLKPENFMFCRRGSLEDSQVKLIDFGLSRRFADGEVLKTSAGTALFAAPEVLKESYGPLCDVWSCGVIMFLLLSGVPPFDGETAKDVLKKVRKAKFSTEDGPWESITASAKALLRHMLEKDQAVRYTAAKVLADPWILGRALDSSGEDLPPQVVEGLRAFGEQSRTSRKVAHTRRSTTSL